MFHAPPSLPQFAGAYLIERLLPNSADGPTYLIKRAKDGHERVAAKRELAPVSAVKPAPPRGEPTKKSRKSILKSLRDSHSEE